MKVTLNPDNLSGANTAGPWSPKLSSARLDRLTTDLRARRDSFGLIQPKPGEKSGNGILYTAEALILARTHGIDSKDWESEIRYALELCRVEKSTPGFFTRGPTDFRNDQEGPDDLCGYAFLSAALDRGLARDCLQFLRHGWFFRQWKLRVRWYFPNEEQYRFRFGFRAWIGRFMSAITTLKWAAGERPGILERLYWAAVVLSSGMFSSNQDPWILSWVSIMTIVENGKGYPAPWFERKVIGLFNKRLLKRYRFGMQDVFKQYFQDPMHPMGEVDPFVIC